MRNNEYLGYQIEKTVKRNTQNLGYTRNKREMAIPKKFGLNNKPLDPQTKAGTSYILDPAGSGNTPEVEVSMYPNRSDILMQPNT